MLSFSVSNGYIVSGVSSLSILHSHRCLMLPSVWKDASDDRVRAFDRHESYIPFRPVDLCLLLIQELTCGIDRQLNEESMHLLVEFNRRLSYAIKLLVMQRYDEWKDSYVMLDPDVDVLLHESHKPSSGDLEKTSERFQKILKRALHEGSFERLTQKDLNEALKARSVLGLDVKLPSKSEIQTVLYSRGRRITTLAVADWRRLWLRKKTYELKTYQRVILLLRREEPEKKASLSNRLFHHFKIVNKSSLHKSILPGKMYFKIFKDIEVSDVDMLIPGSKVQFTTLDFLFLVVPLLLGLISAVFKAITGTLDFNTLSNAMTSAMLVVLPLSYAAKAYVGFRSRRNAYQANLIKKLSLQTLANNAGAVTAILDEVADQETMDAFLAYAFLWKGKRMPRILRQEDMALEVESFLNLLLRRHKIDTRIRFNVRDACEKLEALKLFQRNGTAAKGTLLQVVDLQSALLRLSTVDISKKIKYNSANSKRYPMQEESPSLDLLS